METIWKISGEHLILGTTTDLETKPAFFFKSIERLPQPVAPLTQAKICFIPLCTTKHLQRFVPVRNTSLSSINRDLSSSQVQERNCLVSSCQKNKLIIFSLKFVERFTPTRNTSPATLLLLFNKSRSF